MAKMSIKILNKMGIDTVDKLIQYYKDGNLSDRQLITYIKNSEEYTNDIVKKTRFLDNYDIYDIVERLYYVVNNLTEVVKCKYCDNKATWFKRGLKEGYREICDSKECRKKQLSDTHTGNTLISENRDAAFIAWQASVTQVNDDIIKENIKYDKFIPLITNPIILDYLNNRFKDSESIEETLKRIELGIEEKPICAYPGCKKPVTFIGRQRAMFSKYCCLEHSCQSKERVELCRKTNLEHWGTRNVYDSEKYQQKMLEEYSVRYHWQREDVQEKRNMTCLERYGTIYPTQIKDIMDKVRQTTLERYGSECMFLVPEVFEISHSEETTQKIRETNLERYGSISPLGSEEVQKKIRETNLELYGADYPINVPSIREKAYTPEAKEKIRQTNLERYGATSPFGSPKIQEKIKRTNLERYGYSCVLMNPEIQQKSYETLLENAHMQKSHMEDEVAKYIASLGYVVERHHRTEEFPFNADIYLPKYNLYIEYQGSHFHNTYSFMGTQEDFEQIKIYYQKSQEIKESTDVEKTQYDNMIYVWSDLDVRKRVFAQENSVRYFEIYKQNAIENIKHQLEFLLSCFDKKSVFNISSEVLEKEFEFFKNVEVNGDDELAVGVGHKNYIIKQFQCTEFYKKEMEIFATEPNTRRKLIQNRCKYLNKKEWELTPNDLLTGFKKSGIYYGYSHFNPLWTNWFVHKYGIKTVYDPCGGWGHHMLGMLSCDKIIYNEINKKVAKNVKRIKERFGIDNLEVNVGNAETYIPGDVEGFFMCPPYFNVERYESGFKNIEEYKSFLNNIFSIWRKNNAKVFGLIIREDFIDLIDEKYAESYEINYEESHLTKKNKKKFKERFYIFKKSS